MRTVLLLFAALLAHPTTGSTEAAEPVGTSKSLVGEVVAERVEALEAREVPAHVPPVHEPVPLPVPVPVPVPSAPPEPTVPDVAAPLDGGCHGAVWAPAFVAADTSAAELRVSACRVHPSHSVTLDGHGRVCGYFDTGDRTLHVDVRTLEGGCRQQPGIAVLVHEIGHAWHTLDPARDEWARSLGAESVAECFTAYHLGSATGCPTGLLPDLAVRLSQ